MILLVTAALAAPPEVVTDAPTWTMRPPGEHGPLTLTAVGDRPVALAAGACGPDGAPFVGAGAPVVCALPPALAWTVRADDGAAAFGAVRDRIGDLDEAWRASLLAGPGGTAPDGWTVPDTVWAWSEGDKRALLREDASVVAGRLDGDPGCDVIAAAGGVDLAPGCAPTLPATVRLFPLRGPDGATVWGVEARLEAWPKAAAPPPPAPVPWVPWTLAGALAGGHVAWLVAALWLSRRPAPKSPTPAPAADPAPPPPQRRAKTPAPARATPAAPPARPAVDAYLAKQVQLVTTQPALRAWADRVLSDGVWAWIARGEQALAAAAKVPAGPPGWTAKLDELVRELRQRHGDLARVRRTLTAARDAPARFVEGASAEDRAAWKAIVPWTEGAPTDGGRALAAVGDVDLVRHAFVPWLALAQVLVEALPYERPELPMADLGADPFAEAEPGVRLLGYAWRHVPLYVARDADFLLDGDVAVIGVDAADVWADLPRPAVPAGVVVRVRAPILRALGEAGRPPRAQLAFVREEPS